MDLFGKNEICVEFVDNITALFKVSLRLLSSFNEDVLKSFEHTVMIMLIDDVFAFVGNHHYLMIK